MLSPKEGHTRTPGPTEASSSRWVLGCSPDLPVREGSWRELISSVAWGSSLSSPASLVDRRLNGDWAF